MDSLAWTAPVSTKSRVWNLWILLTWYSTLGLLLLLGVKQFHSAPYLEISTLELVQWWLFTMAGSASFVTVIFLFEGVALWPVFLILLLVPNVALTHWIFSQKASWHVQGGVLVLGPVVVLLFWLLGRVYCNREIATSEGPASAPPQDSFQSDPGSPSVAPLVIPRTLEHLKTAEKAPSGHPETSAPKIPPGRSPIGVLFRSMRLHWWIPFYLLIIGFAVLPLFPAIAFVPAGMLSLLIEGLRGWQFFLPTPWPRLRAFAVIGIPILLFWILSTTILVSFAPSLDEKDRRFVRYFEEQHKKDPASDPQILADRFSRSIMSAYGFEADRASLLALYPKDGLHPRQSYDLDDWWKHVLEKYREPIMRGRHYQHLYEAVVNLMIFLLCVMVILPGCFLSRVGQYLYYSRFMWGMLPWLSFFLSNRMNIGYRHEGTVLWFMKSHPLGGFGVVVGLLLAMALLVWRHYRAFRNWTPGRLQPPTPRK